jgi:serine protease AprX
MIGLLLATLLAMLAVSQNPGQSTLHAQPILLELASQKPDAKVSVIVQKQDQGDEAEKLVTELGGEVTTDLHIINGFGADLPSHAVPQLAQSASVRWISLDAPMVGSRVEHEDNDLPPNTYDTTINADKVWSRYQGNGVGLAVVDSGINPAEDFYNTSTWQSRLVKSASFNSGWNQNIYDIYGHGSHVAGVAAGSGKQGYDPKYVGVAPKANLVNVKVSDDNGNSTASSVVRGLQWINDNRQAYNIRVVNISLNSSVAESYNVNPLCAAAEILWFNGIVVVVSAGNGGAANLLPPANDPYVITVGATDERGTADPSDDVLAPFSAYGTTADGFAKPDLVAPGKDIISLLSMPNSKLALQHPHNVVDQNYFRMSGTSVAAPMVSGAAALIIQSNPGLNPNQVKYRLMATARPFDTSARAGAGYLDIQAAISSTTTQKANLTSTPSALLNLSGNPAVTGSTANWSSANWSSANWSSANWSSTYWAPGE